MKVIVFDTETTGLPEDYNAPVSNSSKWPYIIQLSYIVFNTETKEVLDFVDRIIRLDPAVYISPESINVHKITQERSQEEGVRIEDALAEFAESLVDVDVLVGHNILFDKRMLMAEFHRIGMRNCLYKKGLAIPEYCTMKRNTDRCQLPTVNKKTGEIYFKYPTLSELHFNLFKTVPKGTHNAIVDVMVCLRCFVYINNNYDVANDKSPELGLFQHLYSKYCGWHEQGGVSPNDEEGVVSPNDDDLVL